MSCRESWVDENLPPAGVTSAEFIDIMRLKLIYNVDDEPSVRRKL